jgi:hypothetical protein
VGLLESINGRSHLLVTVAHEALSHRIVPADSR